MAEIDKMLIQRKKSGSFSTRLPDFYRLQLENRRKPMGLDEIIEQKQH